MDRVPASAAVSRAEMWCGSEQSEQSTACRVGHSEHCHAARNGAVDVYAP